MKMQGASNMLWTMWRGRGTVLLLWAVGAAAWWCNGEVIGSQEGFKLHSSDFSDIVKTAYFVDKTMLIKDILRTCWGMFLLTAPRRFGKSTNMDMIKRFFECAVYSNGSIIPKEQTENYKIFTAKYRKVEREEELDVYKDRQFFYDYFGEYPVIYLDFKELNYYSLKDFLSSFKLMVCKEIKRHQYIFLVGSIYTGYKYTLRKLCWSENSQDDFGLKPSMIDLAICLHRHFSKNVIVLIDDYDTQVRKVMFAPGKDLEDITHTIGSFMTRLLKDNDIIYRAIINASMRLSLLAGYTGPNNVRHFDFTKHHEFRKYYGLTFSEVKGLATKFNVVDTMTDIEAWYGGYSAANSKLELFNLYSVVRYLMTRTFDNYWVKESELGNLKYLFLNEYIRREAEALINGEVVHTKLEWAITIEHIEMLTRFLADKPRDSNDMYFGSYLGLIYLLDFGYFAVTEGEQFWANIKIPNKEIQKGLTNMYSVF